MPIPFNSYRYIFPPRPENMVPASELDKYDNGDWFAEVKLDGSCCVLFIGDHETRPMNRHNQVLSGFDIKQSELDKINKGSGWTCVVGEWMNKSKKDINNNTWNKKLVIHDILVHKSQYLLRETTEFRQQLLDDIFQVERKDTVNKFTDNIYLIKNFETNFSETYNNLIKVDMFEGLVLKKKYAPLEMGIREINNAGSLLKFRKPTKNYKF
jgi:ATP-dependent DNA ligase